MPTKAPWAKADSEPSAADLLSDPIAQALMRADGVLVRDVVMIIRDLHLESRTTQECRSTPIVLFSDKCTDRVPIFGVGRSQ